MEPELGEQLAEAQADPDAVGLREAPDWLKPALASARVLWDRTGVIAPVLAAARTVRAAAAGYQHVYDGWDGDIDRVLAYEL